MNDIELTFKGDEMLLRGLAEFAKTSGISAEMDELLLNTKGAKGAKRKGVS